MSWIEEEITMGEFSERFIGNSDFETPDIFDLQNAGIEVMTEDKNGNEVYKPIMSFVVKNVVKSYYTDGKIKSTGNHRFLENGKEIYAKNHKDFIKVGEEMKVVDIEVADLHSYLANGRLNHNTTSGGKGLQFHASVRLRLKPKGQIKIGDRIVGLKVQVVVVKNRLGPPKRTMEFDIFFDRGIDNLGSWIKIMKEHKIVKGTTWMTYVDDATGEEHKFQSKGFPQLLKDNDGLKEQLYKKICDVMVMEYQKILTDDPDKLTFVSTEEVGNENKQK